MEFVTNRSKDETFTNICQKSPAHMLLKFQNGTTNQFGVAYINSDIITGVKGGSNFSFYSPCVFPNKRMKPAN